MFMSQYLHPVDVAIFGKGVFADVIRSRMRSLWGTSVGSTPNDKYPFLKNVFTGRLDRGWEEGGRGKTSEISVSYQQ